MKLFSISTFLGYFIGGCFVLLMLFAPLGATTYFVYDIVLALSKYEKDIAIIERCESSRQNSGSSVRYKRVPIAVTSSGRIVKGQMDEIRWLTKCDSLIGNKVEVLINPQNKKEGYINTFWQLWFMPLLFFIISAIYYPFIIKKYIEKLKINKN
ncbi:MAG: hypothetical protein QF441_03655 [Bacteriovoracaceae bacterium]|jgi:hypothetical protein|nr:hypothetical protein [Bacteriovoracaceae bacterium]